MKNINSENLSTTEAFSRYVLATAILALFFSSTGMPAWVTLLSVYPFATALLKWDPVNAIIDKMANNNSSKNMVTDNIQSAM